jgi:WD40 repeat protein
MTMRVVDFVYFTAIFLTSAVASGVELKAVAVSPDGTTIAAGGERGRACICDARTGKRIQTLVAKGTVHGLGFVRDAKTLVVATDGAPVEIWTAGNAGYARSKEIGKPDMYFGLAVSCDGTVLAVSQNTGWIYFYRTNSWDPFGVLFEPSNFISGLAFAPDGKWLATAGNSFSVWNVSAGSKLRRSRGNRDFDEIKATCPTELRWTNLVTGDRFVDPYATDIAYSPDGKWLAGTTGVGRMNSGGKRVRVWDANNGKELWQGIAAGMLCLSFSADGKSMITGSDDGTMRVWKASSGELIKQWAVHSKAIRQIAPLKDGTFVSAGDDGAVTLWDTAGNALLHYRIE